MMKRNNCEKCDGTGWLFNKRGNVETAVRCECFTTQTKNNLFLAARIPMRYQHCELENFELLNNSIKKAHTAAKTFVKKYPRVKAGLFLVGPCGVGKTHLVVSIINYLLREKGIPCLFYDFRDLLKEIRNTYSDSSHLTEQDVLNPVLNTEILVLDELGSQNMSDWVRDMLMYVINQRYNDNRITFFTSNYFDKPTKNPTHKASRVARHLREKVNEEQSLSERIGFRLRSRLNEMCKLITIEGDDYREIKQAGY